MDESGDPGLSSAVPTYTVAAVLLHDRDWVHAFEQMIGFRRYLRHFFGLYMRTEVKGSQLAKGNGPWSALGLGDGVRKRIFRSFMRFENKLATIQTFAVVIDKSDPSLTGPDDVRERAWRYALQRVETFTRTSHETVMLLPDSGQYLWLRKLARAMRRHSPVGSLYGTGSLQRQLLRVLIDDPVERDSQESFFIQLADLNAYAAYRNRRPITQFPSGMWNELGGAILWQANRHQIQKTGGTPGIVEGP